MDLSALHRVTDGNTDCVPTDDEIDDVIPRDNQNQNLTDQGTHFDGLHSIEDEDLSCKKIILWWNFI